jgi:hypothetical protein
MGRVDGDLNVTFRRTKGARRAVPRTKSDPTWSPEFRELENARTSRTATTGPVSVNVW